MKRALIALAVATLATPMTMDLQAQSDTRPTVAVLSFNTNVLGAGAADYASLGKGVADMMITELVRNGNIRVVERERIDAILKEQELGSNGRMDQQTAVRIGKLLGARYMILGDVTSDLDPRTRQPNTVTIAVRSVNSETSELTNLGDRLRGKPDDLMSLIQQATESASRNLNLPPLPAGPARDAAETAKATAKKAPFQTVMLYSRALEAQDKGNQQEAVALYRQALDKFPEHEPSKAALKKLGQ
jgi:TolB-like protein